MSKHNQFELMWKSSFSITKETMAHVSKALDDEIRYKTTVLLPTSKGRALKSILKDIQSLRDKKESITRKYSKWSKTYDEQRMPRSGTEIDPIESEKTYGLDDRRVELSVKKSVMPDLFEVDKKTILKELHLKAFGTSTGLTEDIVNKMSDVELDGAISALKSIFE